MRRPRVEHVGVIVRDLERNLRLLEGGFGFRSGGIKEMPEVGLRVARLEAANVTVELIQYLSEEPSLGRDVMGGAEGYNHIAMEVPAIEEAVAGLSREGCKVMEGFPRPGSHGRVAFLDPWTTEGLLLELCEGPGKDGSVDQG